MKNEQRSPEALLPLTSAVLHIMLALVDGERHAIGRYRGRAAAVYATGCAGIRNRNRCCSRGRYVRIGNCCH